MDDEGEMNELKAEIELIEFETLIDTLSATLVQALVRARNARKTCKAKQVAVKAATLVQALVRARNARKTCKAHKLANYKRDLQKLERQREHSKKKKKKKNNKRAQHTLNGKILQLKCLIDPKFAKNLSPRQDPKEMKRLRKEQQLVANTKRIESELAKSAAKTKRRSVQEKQKDATEAKRRAQRAAYLKRKKNSEAEAAMAKSKRDAEAAMRIANRCHTIYGEFGSYPDTHAMFECNGTCSGLTNKLFHNYPTSPRVLFVHPRNQGDCKLAKLIFSHNLRLKHHKRSYHGYDQPNWKEQPCEKDGCGKGDMCWFKCKDNDDILNKLVRECYEERSLVCSASLTATPVCKDKDQAKKERDGSPSPNPSPSPGASPSPSPGPSGASAGAGKAKAKRDKDQAKEDQAKEDQDVFSLDAFPKLNPELNPELKDEEKKYGDDYDDDL